MNINNSPEMNYRRRPAGKSKQRKIGNNTISHIIEVDVGVREQDRLHDTPCQRIEQLEEAEDRHARGKLSKENE